VVATLSPVTKDTPTEQVLAQSPTAAISALKSIGITNIKHLRSGVGDDYSIADKIGGNVHFTDAQTGFTLVPFELVMEVSARNPLSTKGEVTTNAFVGGGGAAGDAGDAGDASDTSDSYCSGPDSPLTADEKAKAKAKAKTKREFWAALHTKEALQFGVQGEAKGKADVPDYRVPVVIEEKAGLDGVFWAHNFLKRELDRIQAHLEWGEGECPSIRKRLQKGNTDSG
jgi:hypothetical protein